MTYARGACESHPRCTRVTTAMWRVERGKTPMHEQGFKASSTGLVHGMPPEPCVVVILGVAGDLARTTLVPSLYALGCQRLLPEPFALLGMARRAWDNDTFRDTIRTY